MFSGTRTVKHGFWSGIKLIRESLNAFPSTVGPFWTALAKYGPVTLIAVYLVYQGSQYLPGIQHLTIQNAESLARIERDNTDRDMRYEKIVDLFSRQQTIMLYLLREICVNNAKSEAGRSRCNPRPDSDIWQTP